MMIGDVGSIARLVTCAPWGPIPVHALTSADSISLSPKNHKHTTGRRNIETPPCPRPAWRLMGDSFQFGTMAGTADLPSADRPRQVTTLGSRISCVTSHDGGPAAIAHGSRGRQEPFQNARVEESRSYLKREVVHRLEPSLHSGFLPGPNKRNARLDLVIHLNDYHSPAPEEVGWWVATVEPQTTDWVLRR